MPLIELQLHLQQMIPPMAPGGMGYPPLQQMGHRVPTAGPPGVPQEPAPAAMNPMMQVKVEIINPGGHVIQQNMRAVTSPRRENRNVPFSPVEVQLLQALVNPRMQSAFPSSPLPSHPPLQAGSGRT